MMNYFETNKAAWEEAFDKHQAGYAKNPLEQRLDTPFACIAPDLATELKTVGLDGKRIAQFCCNNGREILSAVNSSTAKGTGFDITENFTGEGTRLAELKGIDCNFVCSNILDIGSEYNETFDLVFSTIGTYCWFEDLDPFFATVQRVLKPGGMYILCDGHPMIEMFAVKGDQQYDADHPDKIAISYFNDVPWRENDGMDYVGRTAYESKTFTSFAHPMQEFVNGIAKNGMAIEKLVESPVNLDDEDDFGTGGKVPLSMIIRARKV